MSAADPSPAPSAVARTVIELLPYMSADALEDLEELIGLELTFPSAARLREARLGLLLDMVAVSQGVFPLVREYLAERAARAKLGEDWPDASTISRAYHDWDRACRAAMRLHYLGGAARVHSETRYQQPRDSYSEEEVMDAIDRFVAAHNTTDPEYIEFFTWGAKLRREANHRGDPDPRIPGPAQVKDLFGDFYRAVAAAGSRRCAD